ncbi:MAG: hypothetical protein HGGPFJEG_02467 [Ignavibacteria bacterium]|nr:hypothetical protein [Ignavibacteria bacterium]
MKKKKNKRESFSEKIIRGIKLARKKMLEEKSLKGEYVIYYEDGKIKRESAKEILKREKGGT